MEKHLSSLGKAFDFISNTLGWKKIDFQSLVLISVA